MIEVIEPLDAQRFCVKLKKLKEKRVSLAYDMVLAAKEFQRAKNRVSDKDLEIKELIDTL